MLSWRNHGQFAIQHSERVGEMLTIFCILKKFTFYGISSKLAADFICWYVASNVWWLPFRAQNSLIIELTYFQIILAQYCVEGLDSVSMVSSGFLTLFYNYSSLRNRRFAIFYRISYIGNHSFTPSVDFRLLRNV